MTEPTPAQKVEQFGERAARVRAEVQRCIVGQRELLDGLLTCLVAGGHGLIEGVPGLGKTLLVRSLSAALDLRFARVQFTPDLMPADITGTTLIQEPASGARTFEFQPGPIFAHVVLADEVNRATPKTQSALLEAMQEHSVTVAKTTHALPNPFAVFATQNPLEMEGTYPLPEAQIDRFLLKLHARFPDRAELNMILERTTGEPAPALGAVLSRGELLEMRALVREVAVAHAVQDYAVRLLEATHPEHAASPARVRRYVRYGASPRGAQACLLAAKTEALLAGRFHVAIADIKRVARAALRHRLILNFEGEAEGVQADALLDDVLAELPETPG
jgi:MoxR-like ATPase